MFRHGFNRVRVKLPLSQPLATHLMFSGIIATTGRIVAVDPLQDGVRLSVDVGQWDISDVAIGDSIANNGVCLTVIVREGSQLVFDVSRETLNCTIGLDAPGEVNLEKALTLADRLGGHLVSGHVDGVGEVLKFEAIGESHELVIRAPAALAGYIARKGSVTVDGVSLTVNAVSAADFSINLIPHTVAVTTLKRLKAGSQVNLEIDLIARYVERMLEWQREPPSPLAGEGLGERERSGL
ncbi:MAG: riboflavin synthase subunit alpha [Rhodocyclales bacterium]|nr:riboflavin synthase subunit alpha [Rhodocyclales bacterium]